MDPEGREMIMVRGQCLPVVRLYQLFDIPTPISDFTQGILLIVESNHKAVCLFADEILGEKQVVMKTIPAYLTQFKVKEHCGIGGCTILGDGNISLILDVSKLIRNVLKV